MMQAGLGAFAPQGAQGSQPVGAAPQGAQGSQPVGAAPPTLPTTVQPPPTVQAMGPQPLPDRLKQLIEESRIVKQINAEIADRGQRARAQAAQGIPTVKEQIARALGATPYNFAGGGIVAFADGGNLDSEDLSLEDLEGLGDEEAFLDKPLYDMLEDYVRGLRSGSAEAPARVGSGRGVVRRGSPTAATPTTPTLPAYLDESRKRDVLSAMRPAAAAQPAATPAARPTPPAATQPPPAARPDGLGDAFNAYRRQQEALARLLEGQGSTPEEVLEARRQYDEAMAGMMKGEEQALADAQAAAGRNIFDNDEILAEMLAGLSGAKTFGEALVGAGAGAARGRASQKKAVAEAKKDINKLRRDLSMKQAELQLARKEGDVNRARAAAVEVQKLKAAIEESSLDYQFKSKDAETRRINANAAMAAAQQRGTTSDFQIDKLVRQAIADVQKRIFIPSGLKPGATRDRLVNRQINEVVAQVAPLGVTREQVMGYFSASATAPGAAPAGWGQPQVVKP